MKALTTFLAAVVLFLLAFACSSNSELDLHLEMKEWGPLDPSRGWDQQAVGNFTVTNKSRKTVWLMGHESTSLYDFHTHVFADAPRSPEKWNPSYRFTVLRDSMWIEPPVPSCGTGYSWHSLEPGQEHSFQSGIWDTLGTWRIGLQVRDKSEGVGRAYWSTPYTYAARKAVY